MTFNSAIHHRKSIRLKEYDYSQNGAYFITICANDREYLFGEINAGTNAHADAGKMVDQQWNKLSNRFQNIQLDEYVVMPNHLHGIIIIVGAPLVGAHSIPMVAPTDAPTIGDIVGAFKSITTHEYIIGVKNNNWPEFNKKLWQRNYYEHIIRNEKSLNKIREYIINNPFKWDTDRNNPINFVKK
jgi:REP element-mobilizing transposase RayT